MSQLFGRVWMNLVGMLMVPNNREVTQGDPLSPTIFNVVVDVVVRHWVTLMVEGVEERVESGK